MFNPKLISKREKIIGAVAVTVVLSGLVYKLILANAINQYQALNKEIVKARLDLERANRLLSNQKQIEDAYSKVFAEKKSNKTENEIVFDVLSEIQAASKGANINLTDIKPQAAKKTGGFAVLSIDLKAEGSVKEITKFLYSLINSQNFIKIETFQISPKSSTNPTLELRLSLNKFNFD